MRAGKNGERIGAGAGEIEVAACAVTRWRTDNGAIEAATAGGDNRGLDLLQGRRRDRVAIDKDRIAMPGGDRGGGFESEFKCGSGVHDGQNHITAGHQFFYRTDVDETRFVRQRLAARAAFIQRGVQGETAELKLRRHRLSHIARAHDADCFDLHAVSPRKMLVVLQASQCTPGAVFATAATAAAAAEGGWFTIGRMHKPHPSQIAHRHP